MRRVLLIGVSFSIVGLGSAGCGSDDGEVGSTADAVSRMDASEGTGGANSDDAEVGDGDILTEDTGVVPENGPPAPETFQGFCPEFVAGDMKFDVGGLRRDVRVELPADPAGAGVLFIWHGFGDSGANFSASLGAAALAESENLITISAEAAIDPLTTEKLAPFAGLAEQFVGPIPPTWSIIDGPEPDLALFDGVLGCLEAQVGIDRSRVYTLGFSQGALWSTRLVLLRSEVLAAAVLWSGGLGSTGGLLELVRFEYETPIRPIPVLATSGGATDVWPNAQLALVNFTSGSAELVEQLRTDGHSAVYCDHGLGHTLPAGGAQWSLDFLLSHVWTEDGASAYFGYDGAGFPDYCTFP